MAAPLALVCTYCGHKFYSKKLLLENVLIEGFGNSGPSAFGEKCEKCGKQARSVDGEYSETTITPYNSTEKEKTQKQKNLEADTKTFIEDISHFFAGYKGEISNMLVIQYAMTEAQRRKESIHEISERLKKIAPNLKELAEKVNNFGNKHSGISSLAQGIAAILALATAITLSIEDVKEEEKRQNIIIEKIQIEMLQPSKKRKKNPFILENPESKSIKGQGI